MRRADGPIRQRENIAIRLADGCARCEGFKRVRQNDADGGGVPRRARERRMRRAARQKRLVERRLHRIARGGDGVRLDRGPTIQDEEVLLRGADPEGIAQLFERQRPAIAERHDDLRALAHLKLARHGDDRALAEATLEGEAAQRVGCALRGRRRHIVHIDRRRDLRQSELQGRKGVDVARLEADEQRGHRSLRVATSIAQRKHRLIDQIAHRRAPPRSAHRSERPLKSDRI